MILLSGASQIVTPLSSSPDGFLVLENGCVVGEQGKIIFVGDIEEGKSRFPEANKVDVSGKVVLPGFVDAHTHLVFGGDRSQEYLMRLRGATYQEIAAAGGGILSTVSATRAASEEELYRKARHNLELMQQRGTTAVEVKSGYGLEWTHEQKMLRVAKRLAVADEVAITFLGAHDFPRETSREDYVDEIVRTMLPAVAQNQLAEFCDVFCDQGYYTIEQTRKIGLRAKQLGLKLKLHVDELADVNGAALAAELGATSADHLIFANDEGIRQMAASNVVAVLLPGTSFSLKMKQHAPARKMIESGVPVAIATDFNPGTCYCHSMQLIMQLATLLYRLTPEETIRAATLHGAAAIDRAEKIGSLEVGKQMDCLIFDIPHFGHLLYNLGVNHLEMVIRKGSITWNRNQDRN
jgi:imidazolonepropionase